MSTAQTTPRTESPVWRAKHQVILDTAHDLFVRLGYGGTTMQSLAEASGFSVGYLYKHFPGKQEILDALCAAHMDVYEDIRARTREDGLLTPLGRLQRELELICRHMAEHRALIPVYAQRETEMAPWMKERVARMRTEDVALLAEARERGEIPEVDPELLAAVLDGAVWGLLKTLAPSQHPDMFLRIPQFIDDLILQPLRVRAQQEGPRQS